MNKYNLDRSEVLYMGDDIPDYEVMKEAGVAVCPSDADSEIRQISAYVSDKRGGEGCVRDIIEQVLRLHNQLDGFRCIYMVTMKNFLDLIRWQNLIMVILTMVLMRYAVIEPLVGKTMVVLKNGTGKFQ